MVQLIRGCHNRDECGVRVHHHTIEVNPGDTETILAYMVQGLERGLDVIAVRVPHVGRIAGITTEGMLWVINPN